MTGSRFATTAIAILWPLDGIKVYASFNQTNV